MGRRSRVDRRREIALAMKEVVAERGVDGASIVEVAKRAELAPGLVHYHFVDKDELLSELLAILQLEARERVTLRLSQLESATAEERLLAVVDAFLAVDPRADRAAVACWVALGAEALRRGPLRAPFEKALAEQVEMLRALIAAALPRAAEPEAASIAPALVAAIHGYFVLAATGPTLVPAGSAVASVRTMALALLANARTGRRS